jgi:hypothetical protein
MKRLALVSCIAAALAAGPLGAQTPTPPAGSATPSTPEAVNPPYRTGTPLPITVIPADPSGPAAGAGDMRRPGDTLPSQPDRRMDGSFPSNAGAMSGGRVSETAPAPRADRSSGDARYRSDLATCAQLEPASRASCRQEMAAARAQGLYRN